MTTRAVLHGPTGHGAQRCKHGSDPTERSSLREGQVLEQTTAKQALNRQAWAATESTAAYKSVRKSTMPAGSASGVMGNCRTGRGIGHERHGMLERRSRLTDIHDNLTSRRRVARRAGEEVMETARREREQKELPTCVEHHRGDVSAKKGGSNAGASTKNTRAADVH